LLTCGLIGLPGSGKTTLFALLAGPEGAPPPGRAGEARRVVTVPDPRLDTLGAHFIPREVIHARIEMVDIPGLVPGERSRAAHFLEGVRGSDALIFVLRGFDDTGGADRPDPAAELGTLETELIFADLAMVENRIAKLEGSKGLRKQDAPLHGVLCRVRDLLGEGTPLRSITLEEDDKEVLAHADFLSSKPIVWVLNVAEDELATAAGASGLDRAAGERGVPLVTISAQVEREIAELEREDARLFMEDLGLDEPGTARVARAVYERLGLISFFTVGDDEVRAWTISRGTRAREAAGKIHSDMERGFIRAEVVSFADYLKAAEAVPGPSGARAAAPATGAGGPPGSAPGERILAAAREQGIMRLEGRDYEVADGDIITIRFNV